MKELTRIPFHDTTIYTTADGTYVALRPVCEALGLDIDGQSQRLQRQSWATTCMMQAVAADGKTREMTFIDRRTFTMWLATIDTSRVKNDRTRELVRIYQCEAADALDQYFNEGVAINPRTTSASRATRLRVVKTDQGRRKVRVATPAGVFGMLFRLKYMDPDDLLRWLEQEVLNFSLKTGAWAQNTTIEQE